MSVAEKVLLFLVISLTVQWVGLIMRHAWWKLIIQRDISVNLNDDYFELVASIIIFYFNIYDLLLWFWISVILRRLKRDTAGERLNPAFHPTVSYLVIALAIVIDVYRLTAIYLCQTQKQTDGLCRSWLVWIHCVLLGWFCQPTFLTHYPREVPLYAKSVYLNS